MARWEKHYGKGSIYPGEQQAILSRELCDQVHERLAEKHPSESSVAAFDSSFC
jgi:hypothetical protein